MVADAGRAKTTMSSARSESGISLARQWRKLSRTWRLMRLRPTADLSTFFETAIPRRVSGLADGRERMRKKRSVDDAFLSKTRLNSEGFKILDERGRVARPFLFLLSPGRSVAIIFTRSAVLAFINNYWSVRQKGASYPWRGGP